MGRAVFILSEEFLTNILRKQQNYDIYICLANENSGKKISVKKLQEYVVPEDSIDAATIPAI